MKPRSQQQGLERKMLPGYGETEREHRGLGNINQQQGMERKMLRGMWRDKESIVGRDISNREWRERCWVECGETERVSWVRKDISAAGNGEEDAA